MHINYMNIQRNGIWAERTCSRASTVSDVQIRVNSSLSHFNGKVSNSYLDKNRDWSWEWVYYGVLILEKCRILSRLSTLKVAANKGSSIKYNKQNVCLLSISPAHWRSWKLKHIEIRKLITFLVLISGWLVEKITNWKLYHGQLNECSSPNNVALLDTFPSPLHHLQKAGSGMISSQETLIIGRRRQV